MIIGDQKLEMNANIDLCLLDVQIVECVNCHAVIITDDCNVLGFSDSLESSSFPVSLLN